MSADFYSGSHGFSKKAMAYLIVGVMLLIALGILALSLITFDYGKVTLSPPLSVKKTPPPASRIIGNGFIPLKADTGGRLLLTGSLTDTVYLLGEPVVCRLTFTNRSRKDRALPILISTRRPEKVLDFEVVRIGKPDSKSGTPVPLLNDAAAPAFDPDTDSVISLPKRCGFFMDIPLNALYAMKLPGVYRVSVKYDPRAVIRESPGAPDMRIWAGTTRRIDLGEFRIVKNRSEADALRQRRHTDPDGPDAANRSPRLP